MLPLRDNPILVIVNTVPSLSASTFSYLYYIIRKDKSRSLTTEFLREISTFCQIATVEQAAINMALTANIRDFEDAIQYSTAVVNNLEAFVTRNQRRFSCYISLNVVSPTIDLGIKKFFIKAQLCCARTRWALI